MRAFASALIAISTLWLASCGGGGGGGSSTPPPPPPPPPPQAQTIAFGTLGPVTVAVSDDVYTNAASGGAGTGAITYSSSSTVVATVSNSGVATLLAPGTTTITANKAASTGYLAATASYTLTITAAAPLSFTAWMGPQDTRVTFAGPLGNLELLRSPQLDCDVANFSGCAGGVASSLFTTPLDSVTYLGREVNWWLRRGNVASPPLRINGTQLDGRMRANAVSWRGKLWRLGGSPAPSAGNYEVWNSDDGDHWTLVAAVTGLPERMPGTIVVFNDRLWLLGGMGGSIFSGLTYNNDVWSSADGITWRRDVVNAPWPGRSGHTALVFNNRLWVIGGSPSPSGTQEGGDDAWSSVNGITWVEETHDAPFAKGAQATVLNGRIYTLGGNDNSTLRNDVWSSADGRDWRRETDAAPFAPRYSNVFAALNGRLIVAAGFDDPTSNRVRNDVWSSADGITWTEETIHAPFSARADVASAVHNGRLFMLNGWITDYPGGLIQPRAFYSREVWSTANGVDWKDHSPRAGGLYPGIYQALAHNDRLWVVGGWDGMPRNDSWNSADGMTWTRVPLVNGFEPRHGQATAIYNGQFWVSGGGHFDYSNPSTDAFADVWRSADGANWTRVTAAAAFGQRVGHSMVVFNNQLVMLGGYADDGTGNDVPTSHVFTSTDGITWTPLTQVAAFDPAVFATALVLNGRIWLLGVSSFTSDVWSSADGATWRAEPVSPLSGLQTRSAAVHDGRLWITGGGRMVVNEPLPVFDNAIYSSPDGATWTQVNAGPHYSARAEASMVSFDDKLWVLGGTDADSLKNDVWKSEDNGVTWRMRYVGSIPYP